MNRIQHFFRAGTAYGLHSPFIYGLYTGVVCPRRGSGEPAGRILRLAQRLVRQYGVKPCGPQGANAMRLVGAKVEFLLVDHPHRCEAEWQALCSEGHWTAAVDLFNVGLLIHNTDLHPEHYILR